MREIIFDTETTGLSPVTDRLVEIGCIELINHIPTGRSFHSYLRPDCAVSPEAERVHGLSIEFLSDKPDFAAIVDDFIAFVGDAPMVAHNASFDLGFINAELARVARPPLHEERIVDTLVLARRRHPAGPNSLDALCARYKIDLSQRILHGALLDATLLAEVYVELIGGRQAHLSLESTDREIRIAVGEAQAVVRRVMPAGIVIGEAELAAHRALLDTLAADAVWRGYLGT